MQLEQAAAEIADLKGEMVDVGAIDPADLAMVDDLDTD